MTGPGRGQCVLPRRDPDLVPSSNSFHFRLLPCSQLALPVCAGDPRGVLHRERGGGPAGGGKFELSEDDAQAWVSAVNDVRLALGTMLDIGPDGPDRLPGDHPMAGHLDVYQWLTVLQEYLVLSLMGKHR